MQVFEQEGWHHELNNAEEEMTYKVGGGRGRGVMVGGEGGDEVEGDERRR